MTRILVAIQMAAIVALVLGAGGCATEDDGGSGETSMKMAPPFGGPDDMARAAALWREMGGYRSWQAWPGLDGWQDGKSPHGKVLRYHVNSLAARNTANPPSGSIIIKENYMARDRSKLGAITVMKRVPGYDRDNGNWFWVKFDPKGNVMKNPKGMSLAGRVAKGMPKGCIACHSNAGGGDYLFINDE